MQGGRGCCCSCGSCERRATRTTREWGLLGRGLQGSHANGRSFLLLLPSLLGDGEFYLNTCQGTGECGSGSQGWASRMRVQGQADWALLHLLLCSCHIHDPFLNPHAYPVPFPCFYFPRMNLASCTSFVSCSMHEP